MSDMHRWTIPELQARYSLEPELNDVFVEGSYDREVLSAAFEKLNRPEIFYEIDSVEVPPETLHQLGLTSGNKQRVVALAKEFESLDPDAKVTCLVDRDLDHWLGATENTARLKWTVYCSIESHFMTREIIVDVVLTTARARIGDSNTFVDSLVRVLKELYAMRLADRELGLSLKWVALRKYLSSSGAAIHLDTARYITATLNASAALGSKEKFLASVQKWAKKFDCDVRMAARGHDYTELLAWAVSEFEGHKSFIQQTAIERLFVLLAKTVPTIGQELLQPEHATVR